MRDRVRTIAGKFRRRRCGPGGPRVRDDIRMRRAIVFPLAGCSRVQTILSPCWPFHYDGTRPT